MARSTPPPEPDPVDPVDPVEEPDPDQLTLADMPADEPDPEPTLAEAQGDPADMEPTLGDPFAYDEEEAATFHLQAQVPLRGLSGYMRLPDGTVVTCFGNYTAQHVGTHAFIVIKDGETVEVPFLVIDPNAPAVEDDLDLHMVEDEA